MQNFIIFLISYVSSKALNLSKVEKGRQQHEGLLDNFILFSNRLPISHLLLVLRNHLRLVLASVLRHIYSTCVNVKWIVLVLWKLCVGMQRTSLGPLSWLQFCVETPAHQWMRSTWRHVELTTVHGPTLQTLTSTDRPNQRYTATPLTDNIWFHYLCPHLILSNLSYWLPEAQLPQR